MERSQPRQTMYVDIMMIKMYKHDTSEWNIALYTYCSAYTLHPPPLEMNTMSPF